MTPSESLEAYAAFAWTPKELVEVRCFGNRESGFAPKSFFWRAADLPNHAQELGALNRQGVNIYAGILPRLRDGGKTDKDAAAGWVVWADFDDIEPRAAWKQATGHGLPRPTAVIASGHGAHLFWGLTDPAEPADLSNLVADVAAHLDADPSVKNPSRILRLPGFVNHKPPIADCVLLHSDPALRYDFNRLRAVVPHFKPEAAPRSTQGDRSPENARKRAVAYLQTIPGEAKGQGRNNTGFRVAATLRRDFALSDGEAFELLADWNQRNLPPLDDQELKAVFDSAGRNGKSPTGAKLMEAPRVKAAPKQAVASIPEKSPQGAYAAQLEAESASPRIEVRSPWPMLSKAAGLFRGGQLITVAGQEGHGKSMIAQQSGHAIHKAGGRFGFLPLEGCKADWEARALCLFSESWTPLDKEASIQARVELHAQHKKALDAFAFGCAENPHTPRLNPETGKNEGMPVTPEAVLEWIQVQYDSGVDAVFIDNFSHIDFDQGQHEWRAQQTFINQLLGIVRDERNSAKTLFLVAHLRRRSAQERRYPPNTDDLQGSKAVAKSADAVIVLEHHAERDSNIKTVANIPKLGFFHERTAYVLKARNAPGAGLSFAFDMHRGGRLEELGVIDPREKGR